MARVCLYLGLRSGEVVPGGSIALTSVPGSAMLRVIFCKYFNTTINSEKTTTCQYRWKWNYISGMASYFIAHINYLIIYLF
jgi:hypothetical protein